VPCNSPGSRLAAAPLDELRIPPAELRGIKRFRDTLWLVARAMAHGKPPAAEDLDVVNAAATTNRPEHP
jgi:hypothetical protein